MIKLYNGDCLEVMDKLINQGIKVEFAFTSPPYNRKRNDKYNNFDDINKNYLEFLQKVIDKNLQIADYFFLNL